MAALSARNGSSLASGMAGVANGGIWLEIIHGSSGSSVMPGSAGGESSAGMAAISAGKSARRQQIISSGGAQ
jgi:hypothetical protein